jgi:alkylation response protein AidB-like acyl-CoA dehydrogenase
MHDWNRENAELLSRIAARATRADRSGAWPAEDLAELAAAGAYRWFVPQPFGGESIDPLELHLRYEQIAAASLATALIISQRDSAIGLIDGSESPSLQELILPKMATGEWFATIGIAQLTTSRQGGHPALRATETSTGFQIDGVIPWSTGAAQSKFIIAGAVLDDGRQILFALPTDLPGITIHPPMALVALSASVTTQIDCHRVELEKQWLLRGPAPRALAGRSKSIPNGQAFLALGLCRGGLDVIATHDSSRARLALKNFLTQLDSVRNEIISLCTPGRGNDAAADGPRLRGQCNDLALRIAHAAIALFKGSALHLDHPAQRIAREAMFLLVWSCPDPVIECTLEKMMNA